MRTSEENHLEDSIAPSSESGKTSAEIKKRELAELMRKANKSGVTRWLGLNERLDPLVVLDISNYRILLKGALECRLRNNGEEEGDKKSVAQKLLDMLKEYEILLEEGGQDI